MTQFTYQPDMRALVAGGAAALLVLIGSYWWARGRAGRPLRMFLVLVRAAVVGLIVVALLDPQWVEKLQHKQRARMAVLMDTSKSMNTQDVPGSRLGAGRDWVQRHVLGNKPGNLDVSAFHFDQVVAPLSDLNAASPTGSVTALTSALENLLAAPAEDPLLGVVLVSDGIETSTKTPEAIAKQFRRKGVPIHTVITGTTNEMKDVVVENVQVKRAVPNESPTKVTLSLRSIGFAGQGVLVQIRRERDVLATKTVQLNGATQTVEIDFTPRQKGFQIYEVYVTPSKDEWLAYNNRRQFGLEVTDPTIRVLYMEGTPQQNNSPMPEWKYLKDALQSDKDIKVTVLYRKLGNNGQYLNTVDSDPDTNERIYPIEHPTKGFPRTLTGMLDYDVVVHSDIRIDSFTPDQLVNLAKLVEQYGGGFVMIGGNSAFGKGGYHRTILDRIIPVAMASSDDSDSRPIQLVVPPNAWTHPLIAFSPDRAETRRIWGEKFPTLYGMNGVERAKPGATVLAQEDGNGGNVLIAVQEVGKGRSMAFTSDTTRSWGRDFETIWGEPLTGGTRPTEFNCDSRYYRQFWVNAIRWLAAGKAGKTNQAVILELAKGYVAPGDPVKATIKVRNPQQQDIPTADVTLRIGTGTNDVIHARYDSASRAYLADVRLATNGSHIITAAAVNAGVMLGDDRQLLVGETTDREIEDLRVRPDTMLAIARASGGEAFVSGQAPKDASVLFANVPPTLTEYRRTPLWDKAWWLGSVLGLLTLEWSLRRWRGLA